MSGTVTPNLKELKTYNQFEVEINYQLTHFLCPDYVDLVGNLCQK